MRRAISAIDYHGRASDADRAFEAALGLLTSLFAVARCTVGLLTVRDHVVLFEARESPFVCECVSVQ